MEQVAALIAEADKFPPVFPPATVASPQIDQDIAKLCAGMPPPANISNKSRFGGMVNEGSWEWPSTPSVLLSACVGLDADLDMPEEVNDDRR